MATHTLCQSPSFVSSLGLPGVAASSSSSNGSSCCTLSRRGYGVCPLLLSASWHQRAARRCPLPVSVAAEAAEAAAAPSASSDGLTINLKAVILNNKVFHDKTTNDLNPLSRQSTLTKTPAASPISVVATEVQTAPLEKLKSGYLKFKENYTKDLALVKNLAEGQQPPYMIIACADSRVDPCTVLSLGPGEAFVLRNIGNMVPPYSANSCFSVASALEYGVLHLKVKHLVIIGHSQCGAIKVLMGIEDDGSNRFSEFIEDWVLISKGASRKVKNLLHGSSFDDRCTLLEKEAVNHSLWNCLSFPFVREKIASGDLTLHGGYYDFVNGAFESWSLDIMPTMTKVEKVQ